MERNENMVYDGEGAADENNGYNADGNAAESEHSQKAPAEAAKPEKPGKAFVCVTYILFVIAMLAGLFAPLYGRSGSTSEKMLFAYLPGMLNSVYAKFANKVLITKNLPFFVETASFDYITSLLGLLYALVCLIGLIGIIPVLCTKEDAPNKTGKAFAFEAVMIAFAYLFTLMLANYYSWGKYTGRGISLPKPMLIAMLAGVVILAVQSIVSKGYMGVFKLIGAILAVIAVAALFDVTYVIKGLKTPLGNLSKVIAGNGETFTDFMYNTNGHTYTPYALYNIYWIVMDSSGFFNAMKMTEYTKYYAQFNYAIIAISVITAINIAIDFISLCTWRKVKADGSYNKGKKAAVFDIGRYAINLVAVVGFIVSARTVGKYFPGIYAYLIALICVIQIVVVIIRMAVASAKAKAYDAERQSEEEEQEEDEQQTLPGFEDAAQPKEESQEETKPAPEEEETEESGEQMQIDDLNEQAETEEPQPEEEQPEQEEQPQPEEEQPEQEEEQEEPEEPKHVSIFDAAYDDGETVEPEPQPEPEPTPTPVEPQPEPQPVVVAPVAAAETEEAPEAESRFQNDKFLKKLSPELQDEFEEVFLNRTKGKLGSIPEYEVGGDNSDFFTAVFVHINRTRGICSDDLLAKIYRQIDKN